MADPTSASHSLFIYAHVDVKFIPSEYVSTGEVPVNTVLPHRCFVVRWASLEGPDTLCLLPCVWSS